MIWLAIPMGVFGCIMTFLPRVGFIGILLMMVGALIFIRGNRLKQAQEAERRHRETVEAIRSGKI